MKIAKASVRVWTRLYTWGMPPHVRDARRAEIESDLWEHEHDRHSDLHLGPTVQLLSRLVLGVPYDLQWRLEQGIPHLQNAVAAGPARQPFITLSALTCSLVIHVLALATTLWLASRPIEQVTRDTAVQSTSFRPVELSDVGTGAPAPSEVPQAQSSFTNNNGSVNATHTWDTIMPIQTASVWKRIAGSVSRVAVTAAMVLGIAPAPNLASATQPSTTAFAVPVDPIVAILDAFRTHQIVAVGDSHGNEQVHAFRLALVRDPRIADIVNDIVVEFGNALHQEVIDRFVEGEDVPYEVLRKVWRDTTVAAPNWDLPIYEQFFRAVRDVNATRPRDRQLRILLGDPPLDWSVVKTPDDFVRFMKTTEAIRSAHPAQIVEREVIKRNRRALVIYGEAHLWRVTPSRSFRSLIGRLEDSGAKAFTISTRTTIGGDPLTLQPNVASWRIPSLAVLRGTTLGTASFRFYMPYFGPPERDPLRDLRMEQQFDAVLYLGPREAMSESQLSPTLCGDATYVELRVRRMELVSQTTPGGASGPIKRLRESCAAAGTGR